MQMHFVWTFELYNFKEDLLAIKNIKYFCPRSIRPTKKLGNLGWRWT